MLYGRRLNGRLRRVWYRRRLHSGLRCRVLHGCRLNGRLRRGRRHLRLLGCLYRFRPRSGRLQRCLGLG